MKAIRERIVDLVLFEGFVQIMLRPWLCETIKNSVYGLEKDVTSSLGTLTQILSFDDNEAVTLLHDGEYLIYGILDDKTRKDLSKVAKEANKELARAFAVVEDFAFAKANIMDNSGNCSAVSTQLFIDADNYVIHITGMSIVKWAFDEAVSSQSKTLLSNPELAVLINKMPYGIIGVSSYVINIAFSNILDSSVAAHFKLRRF